MIMVIKLSMDTIQYLCICLPDYAPSPLSSQQSLKVVGFDDPLIARVPYDLYEARARDSVIRMDGSATRTPAVYAAGELWV